jgi:hypothetical protein
MTRLPPLLFALLPLAAADPGQMARDLDQVARIASAMVDGDLCQRIVTDRARKKMMRVDPRDRWAGSDNYDVNHQPFNLVKKTLQRLALLVDFPCDANLWMPLDTKPPQIHIVIRNKNELSQFWPWGALHQDVPPPMRKVLDTGQRITVRDKPGWISVLAPVRNSLGDIVGLVEVAAQATPDPRANVK